MVEKHCEIRFMDRKKALDSLEVRRFARHKKPRKGIWLAALGSLLLAVFCIWAYCFYFSTRFRNDDLVVGSSTASSDSLQKMNLHDECELDCRRNGTVKKSEFIEATSKLDGTQNAQLQGDFKGDAKFNGSLLPSLLRIRRGSMKSKRQYPKLLRIRRDTDEMKNYYPEYAGGLSCKFPSGLKTVEVLCKMWSQTVTCKSYCVYGSTYKEGISRTHFCTYIQDKWSEEFEECKPFVDCRLKLTAPGSINCVENRVKESPSCEISCEMYEDQDGLPSQTYSCMSDGTWKPALPYCVALKGTPLVSAPKVTQHVSVSYPQRQGAK